MAEKPEEEFDINLPTRPWTRELATERLASDPAYDSPLWRQYLEEMQAARLRTAPNRGWTDFMRGGLEALAVAPTNLASAVSDKARDVLVGGVKSYLRPKIVDSPLDEYMRLDPDVKDKGRYLGEVVTTIDDVQQLKEDLDVHRRSLTAEVPNEVQGALTIAPGRWARGPLDKEALARSIWNNHTVPVDRLREPTATDPRFKDSDELPSEIMGDPVPTIDQQDIDTARARAKAYNAADLEARTYQKTRPGQVLSGADAFDMAASAAALPATLGLNELGQVSDPEDIVARSADQLRRPLKVADVSDMLFEKLAADPNMVDRLYERGAISQELYEALPSMSWDRAADRALDR